MGRDGVLCEGWSRTSGDERVGGGSGRRLEVGLSQQEEDPLEAVVVLLHVRGPVGGGLDPIDLRRVPGRVVGLHSPLPCLLELLRCDLHDS